MFEIWNISSWHDVGFNRLTFYIIHVFFPACSLSLIPTRGCLYIYNDPEQNAILLHCSYVRHIRNAEHFRMFATHLPMAARATSQNISCSYTTTIHLHQYNSPLLHKARNVHNTACKKRETARNRSFLHPQNSQTISMLSKPTITLK